MRSDRWMMVSGFALTMAPAPGPVQAADIVQTLENAGHYGKLVDAIERAGLTETLKGDGSYTIFAPSDAAFSELQRDGQGQQRRSQQDEGGQGQNTQSQQQAGQNQSQSGQGRQQNNGGEVLQQVSTDQLKKILTHHVVEGQELTTKDLFGQQQTVQTLSGDQLQVDGTSAAVVLVPTGLSVARVGDEVFVRREVAAMARPAVTVSMADGQGQQDGQQQAASNQSGQSGQTSGQGQSGQQQAASGQQDQDGPAMGEVREEYREATQGSGQSSGQSGTNQQQAASTSQGSGQASGQSSSQQQAGQGQERPMSEQQGLLRAAMVVTPDIMADNGIIHGIDQVLVPQQIEQELMGSGNQQQN